MDVTKPQSEAVVLSATLRKDGETLGEFAAELRRLTKDEMRNVLLDAAQYADCCYNVHEVEQPCPIGHDPLTARKAHVPAPLS